MMTSGIQSLWLYNSTCEPLFLGNGIWQWQPLQFGVLWHTSARQTSKHYDSNSKRFRSFCLTTDIVVYLPIGFVVLRNQKLWVHWPTFQSWQSHWLNLMQSRQLLRTIIVPTPSASILSLYTSPKLAGQPSRHLRLVWHLWVASVEGYNIWLCYPLRPYKQLTKDLCLSACRLRQMQCCIYTFWVETKAKLVTTYMPCSLSVYVVIGGMCVPQLHDGRSCVIVLV